MESSYILLIVCSLIGISVLILIYLDPKNNCVHQWKILSETKEESYFERYKRLQPDGFLSPRNQYVLEHMCRKKLIQIITCPQCGKLKRYSDHV